MDRACDGLSAKKISQATPFLDDVQLVPVRHMEVFADIETSARNSARVMNAEDLVFSGYNGHVRRPPTTSDNDDNGQ